MLQIRALTSKKERMTTTQVKIMIMRLKRQVLNFRNSRAVREILKNSCSILQVSIDFPIFKTSSTDI